MQTVSPKNVGIIIVTLAISLAVGLVIGYLGSAIGTLISLQHLTGIGTIKGSVMGFLFGYPLGALLGTLGAARLFMRGGSWAKALIGVVGAFVLIIVGANLGLNNLPEFMSLLFVMVFPLASVAGYVLGLPGGKPSAPASLESASPAKRSKPARKPQKKRSSKK